MEISQQNQCQWTRDRRYASPLGGQIMGAPQDDLLECEPPLPVVDLVTGKCKLGKVSRTVFRAPLMLDLTVVCTSGAVVRPPGVTSDTVVPPATVASEGIDVGTSVPVVAAPVPVVEQLSPLVRERVPVIEFPQPLLSEPPELLQVVAAATALPSSPLSGRSSSSSLPTLLWGVADDSSPSFLAGHSQDVPDEGNLFNVSQSVYYCRRRWTNLMNRFLEIRSHMCVVNSFWGQSPHCLCLHMHGRLVLLSC